MRTLNVQIFRMMTPHKLLNISLTVQCFYFVCTYDNSRDKLYKFEGEECVIKMIRKLRSIGFKCIQQMQKYRDAVKS